MKIINYELPKLDMSLPFTAEKFREAATELQGEADDINSAIAQLIEIADAMDGTSPAAELVARDMTFPGSSVTITTLVDPASLNEPLNAAEAFAPGLTLPVGAVAPPIPVDCAGRVISSVPPVPTTMCPPGTHGTPAAPPPPPAPPVPATDAELDSKGNPWTAGVHADNKSKKQDGTWKARRGGTKAPATNRADGGPAIDDVDLKTFQAAMGKLIAAGVEINEITKSVSQTVFGDMSREIGGIEHVLAADDAKLTGKAFNALKAIAIQTGNGSAF